MKIFEFVKHVHIAKERNGKVFSKKYHSIGKALEKVFFRSGTPTALAIMVLAQQGFAS